MQWIKSFSELRLADIPLVGGKNASLGEMYGSLTAKGVKIPNGFAVTAEAYRYYLRHNQLEERIGQALAELDIKDVQALALTGSKIRHWLRNADMPGDLATEIREAYLLLEEEYGANPDVAVRSSATAEDLPSASFAGQQETYLNIRGSQTLIDTCRQVFASLFTDRAISYRHDQGFAHMDVALSIGVQKMVRSDLASSGVIFTLDTESGFRDVVFITAAYGLGENVVQGAVNPDEYYVFKPTLREGYHAIINRQLGDKALRMIYSTDPLAGHSTQNVEVAREQRQRFSLTDDEVLALARYAVTIEEHYSELAGHPQPMDIEWAKDGESGELFILQARPETVQAVANTLQLEQYHLVQRGPLLTHGKSVGQRIASGRARTILEARDMHNLREGEVLVSDITDPDWEPVMKKAAAIVTNRGGRTCHAAIVARELGIPAVVGCGDATQVIHSGEEVTVSCAEGDEGYIYAGALEFRREILELDKIPTTRTRLMVNLGNPEQAFLHSRLPVAGVGLARLEFIINHSIRAHPMALLNLAEQDETTRDALSDLITGYDSPEAFYIDKLACGVATLAAAFHPRPVIVRLSDFKSNEYASLIGGQRYEPEEENPMLGLRGAARYPSAQFADSFALECAALKRVRTELGLKNVALMVPFVRTVEEARTVVELLAANGLRRGEDGLKLYLMCEIPANALLASDFLEYFDGFSIGSNDLTQLTLGVDRDSASVGSFDEANPAVLKLMEMAIQACHMQGKYVGICGQAPSDRPEITRWLVEQGIDAISLNPDSVPAMLMLISETESKMK